MAALTGLEPATFAVTGRRSNQLSYKTKGDGIYPDGQLIGRSETTRTSNPSAPNRVRYHLRYTPTNELVI